MNTSQRAAYFHYDRSGNRIAEYDTTGATAVLLREYFWLGGQIVSVIEGGVTYSIRADNINRPVFATNPAGTKTWTASWLPFGGVHATTGSPITLRFPGQWYEAESLLHQNWMRDYDPTTGRYLQADPLGLVDGASVYGYARQSPLRNVDPRGEAITLADLGNVSNVVADERGNGPQYCANDCDEEWIVARNICLSELSKPSVVGQFEI